MAEMSDAQVQEYFDKQGDVELPDDVVAEEEAKEVARTEAQGKEPKEKEPAKAAPEKKDEEGKDRGNLGAALAEERAERRALKERLEKQEREHAEWRTAADKKLQHFIDEVAKGKQVAPPDESDPVAFFKHQNEQLAERLKQLEAGEQTRTANSKATEQLNAFVTAVRAKEAEFAKDTPDYNDASAFLTSFWRTEAEFAGVSADDVQKTVFIRASQFSNSAMQRGENPAKAAYELAKKLGYKKAEAAPSKEEKRADETLETLKRIEKGQEASKGVSGVKAADDDLTISSLSNMSDEEISEKVSDPKFWKKLEKRFA